MRFERGKDPKSAMEIGIGAQWTKAVTEVQELYKYEFPNENTMETMKDMLEKLMGMPVDGRLYWEGDEEEGEWKIEFKLLKNEVSKGK